jgi:hypothetical protein
MSDEIDKIKKLVSDTQNEIAVENSNCWFWFSHKWSRWTGTAEKQHRYCLKCSKQQEINKECKHDWEFSGNISNHKIDQRVVAVEKNYKCKKCSVSKRVLSYALGRVEVDFY